MHLPECHFKVAELKMHLRSLARGVVSCRAGCEVVPGMRMAERVGGRGNGEACVFSVARAAADPKRFIKMSFSTVPGFWKRHEGTL